MAVVIVGCGSTTSASTGPQSVSRSTRTHAYVGVILDPSTSGGARVSKQPDAEGNPPVRTGSPAARAGIHAGDLVTAVNGRSISSTDAFIAAVDTHKPGETITLTITRGTRTRSLKLTLGARPNTP